MAAYVSRRTVALLVVGLQLGLIVRAYATPLPVFGFQMFPEASRWRADVHRVLSDGARVDVRGPWPGGYRWEELVQGRGLSDPFTVGDAAYGVEATLFFLGHALDWVAAHTPADAETARLEAVVEYWHNGRGPISVTLHSAPRSPP